MGGIYLDCPQGNSATQAYDCFNSQEYAGFSSMQVKAAEPKPRTLSRYEGRACNDTGQTQVYV